MLVRFGGGRVYDPNAVPRRHAPTPPVRPWLIIRSGPFWGAGAVPSCPIAQGRPGEGELAAPLIDPGLDGSLSSAAGVCPNTTWSAAACSASCIMPHRLIRQPGRAFWSWATASSETCVPVRHRNRRFDNL
jgi:hypothetical protein